MIWAAKEREAELRGEERGEKIGGMKYKYNVATKMILKSMPTELIAEVTDLPLSEVQSLRSRLQK